MNPSMLSGFIAIGALLMNGALFLMSLRGRLLLKYGKSRSAAILARYTPLKIKKRPKRRLRIIGSPLAKGGKNQIRVRKVPCACCGGLFDFGTKKSADRAMAHGFKLPVELQERWKKHFAARRKGAA